MKLPQVAQQLPPWALPAAVGVAGLSFLLWVYRQHEENENTPDWRAGGGPAAVTRAGPFASWAAAMPPTMTGPCVGLSVGCTPRQYAPTLVDSPGSFIGEC